MKGKSPKSELAFLTGGINTSDRRDKTHFFADVNAALPPLCGKRFVRVWNLEASLIITFGAESNLGGAASSDSIVLEKQFAFTEAFESHYEPCLTCLKILRKLVSESIAENS